MVKIVSTYRLNSSESLARRKNKSPSVRSESRRTGALNPRNIDGTGRSETSLNTNSSSVCLLEKWTDETSLH